VPLMTEGLISKTLNKSDVSHVEGAVEGDGLGDIPKS